jgi:hypothetical protein
MRVLSYNLLIAFIKYLGERSLKKDLMEIGHIVNVAVWA